MQINPANNLTPLAAPRRTDGAAISAGSDQANFSQATALRTALDQDPDIRSDKVAQAKALIATTNYPPDEIIDRISNLMAMHLAESEEQSSNR